MNSVPPTLAHRVVTSAAVGAALGAVMAAVLSAFVLIQGLLDGGAAASAHRVSVAWVVGAYWLAGPAAGLLAGALRPWYHTWLGLALAGWVGGATVYGIVAVMKEGATADTAFVAALLGLVAGVPAAFLIGGRRLRRGRPAQFGPLNGRTDG